MSKLAEDNKKVCDELLAELEDDGFSVEYQTLHTRTIVHKSKDALERAMDYLTGSFSFECKQIFVSYGFGYEIELPRIMINFED